MRKNPSRAERDLAGVMGGRDHERGFLLDRTQAATTRAVRVFVGPGVSAWMRGPNRVHRNVELEFGKFKRASKEYISVEIEAVLTSNEPRVGLFWFIAKDRDSFAFRLDLAAFQSRCRSCGF